VPRRANKNRGFVWHVAGAAVASCGGVLARARQRPVDAIALLAAGATAVVIVVNALFLQSGAHPAPFFATPTRPLFVDARTKPVEAVPAKPDAAAVHPSTAPSVPPQQASAPAPAAAHNPQTVSMRRNDPIAELIGPSPRIAAVQRVLSEFGYGQIKPSGMLDPATSGAIEKFEREHKMPVTGRISSRLVTELGAMAGHPLE